MMKKQFLLAAISIATILGNPAYAVSNEDKIGILSALSERVFRLMCTPLPFEKGEVVQLKYNPQMHPGRRLDGLAAGSGNFLTKLDAPPAGARVVYAIDNKPVDEAAFKADAGKAITLTISDEGAKLYEADCKGLRVGFAKASTGSYTEPVNAKDGVYTYAQITVVGTPKTPEIGERWREWARLKSFTWELLYTLKKEGKEWRIIKTELIQ